MSAPKSYLRIAAVGAPDHGPMALVIALAVRFGYAGWLESAAGWETPRRFLRVFNGRHGVCDDQGRPTRTDALILVVAADEGPRDGTRTQLRAARQVGIEPVIVFLTRSSALVDEPSRLDVAEADTRRLLAEFGYPADDVVVVRGDAQVSAQGSLDELRAALDRLSGVPHPAPVPERRTPSVVVGLLGAAGHGKTTLLAAITRRAGKDGSALSRPGEVQGITRCDTADRLCHFIEGPADLSRLLPRISTTPGMEAAVLVVAADAGPTTLSREHALLARHLGIPTLAVFLNKCDSVDDTDLETVERRLRVMLTSCGWPGEEVSVIRGSALDAEAPTRDDERGMGCVADLLSVLNTQVHPPTTEKPFLLTVAETFNVRGYDPSVVGRVERGRVAVGDVVEWLAPGRLGQWLSISSVLEVNGRGDLGFAGDFVRLLLSKGQSSEVSRGHLLAAPGSVSPHGWFEATVYLPAGGDRVPIYSGLEVEFTFRSRPVPGHCVLPPGIEAGLPGQTVAMTAALTRGTLAVMEVGQHFVMGRTGGRGIGVGVVTRILD
jgi:elongation factor Tu